MPVLQQDTHQDRISDDVTPRPRRLQEVGPKANSSSPIGNRVQRSPIKIMHVVGSLVTGGAETVVATLCRLHRKEGHQPSIQALGRGGRISTELEAEGLSVTLHQETERRSVFARIRDLADTIRREQPDIVHCHSPGPTILGAVAARLAGARAVIATRHDQVRGRLDFRHRLLFRGAASLCYRIVAVSNDAGNHLARSLGSVLSARVITIPNGAAPAAMGDSTNPDTERAGLNLVTVGRLVQVKDHARLLEALAIVARQLPSVRLRLVGCGEEEKSLRRRCADLDLGQYVEFLGERHDVGRWLRQADLFIMSSVTEGLPVALLEALEAGIPQIVTDVGGMPEVVNLAKSGLVVPPCRPDLMAEAILSLAARPEEREQMARNAKECYVSTFSPERFAQRYLDLYEECLTATGER